MRHIQADYGKKQNILIESVICCLKMENAHDTMMMLRGQQIEYEYGGTKVMGKKLWALFAVLVLLTLPVCAFAVELPEAEVREITPPVIDGKEYNYAMEFKAVSYDGDCKDWEVDFELVFNKNIPSGKVTIAGQYDAFGSDWVEIPVTDDIHKIRANEPIRVMKKGLELTDFGIDKFTYELLMLLMGVDPTFQCSVYIDPEYLSANPDLGVKLSLNMYDPGTGKRYVIGNEYSWGHFSDPVPVIDMPQTGDNANLALLVLLAAASMAGLFVMNRNVRGKREN